MATAASAFCEPCSERKKQIEAIKWCSDCEESLCKECTDCHTSMKATRNHHVVDLHVAHSFPTFPRSGYKFCEIHSGHYFEYFCNDHQSLCCRECMTSDLHRSCRQVSTIDAASKHVKSSKLFKNVTDELDHILETFGNIAADRQKNVALINSSVETVKDSIFKFKSEVIKHVDILEKSLQADLDRMQAIAVDTLNIEMDQAVSETEVVHVYKNQMNFVQLHGSDKHTFLFVQTLKTALHDLKDQLISKIARLRSISIKHNIPEDALASLTLGSVIETAIPCTEKFKLHIDDYKLYRNFELCQTIDMTQIDKKAFVSGMAVCDDRLFLCNCDWNHNTPKVLVCNINGEFIADIEVKGAPWDIAVLPVKGKAVVVLPNTNSIQFIDTKTLTSGREVKMAGSDEKRGITATKDRIFVGGMDRYIYILDFEGNLLSTIFVNGEKFCYLLSVSRGDLVYSDFSRIHRIKLDGTEVYTFKSPDLENPKKIATDALGNVYIAGKDSHSIHRLTPDGTFLDVILHADNQLCHPRALCIDGDHNKMFISNKSGKELLIYKCT